MPSDLQKLIETVEPLWANKIRLIVRFNWLWTVAQIANAGVHLLLILAIGIHINECVSFLWIVSIHLKRFFYQRYDD